MRLRPLLRALWVHHRRFSLVALALALSLFAAPLLLIGPSDEDAPPPESEARPHLILDRVWFDRYPDDARSDVNLWVWFSSGIGIHQRGSAYRATFDIFDFSRDRRALDMTFLQDDERAQTDFTIERCDHAPFDLCLTLERPARGPHRYYGFSGHDHAAREPAWTRDLAARARATARATAR